MHIPLLHSAKTAFLHPMVRTVNFIRPISILLIMGLHNRYSLVFRVHLIAVVMLECGAAISDKVKIVDFPAQVLQITAYRLHAAEVDIFRTCNGLRVVEPAAEGKLIRITAHHISRAANLRVPQQFNRVRLLKVHLRHLPTTIIHSGHPKTYRLKTRV